MTLPLISGWTSGPSLIRSGSASWSDADEWQAKTHAATAQHSFERHPKQAGGARVEGPKSKFEIPDSAMACAQGSAVVHSFPLASDLAWRALAGTEQVQSLLTFRVANGGRHLNGKVMEDKEGKPPCNKCKNCKICTNCNEAQKLELTCVV